MNIINKIKSYRHQFLKKVSDRKLKSGITKLLIENKTLNPELKAALDFYKTKDIQTFPYSFPEKHRKRAIDIQVDEIGLFAFIDGHKMYFKKEWSKLSCQSYLRTLFVEQDSESPHSYCSEEFHIESEDIVIDVGTAEGYFTLLNMDQSLEIYAFEMDSKWNEVLRSSFSKHEHKISLFEGKLGNKNSEGNFKLDDFPELYDKNLFIKIDVEGSERQVFEGMKRLLNENQKIKIAVCTYHQNNDAEEFETFFKSFGYQTAFSSGYMLYRYAKDLKAPYLRKGVLRAWK
jgi:hypothetical protein